VICVQIHTPVGRFYPLHPAADYVPRELLAGLEASLDNSSKLGLIVALSVRANISQTLATFASFV
jgi:hypothetical protein